MARQDYQTTKNDVRYSDIFINLNVNPGNNQLARHTNENAVRRSIKNLILTSRYERLYQPDVYCKIKKALFEPMGPIIASTIKTLIEEVIKNHEKRANLLEVVVKPDYDQNAYYVSVMFSMINISEPVQLDISLQRSR